MILSRSKVTNQIAEKEISFSYHGYSLVYLGSHTARVSVEVSVCSIIHYTQGAFQSIGNQLMLHPFTRKTLKSPLKITDRSPSYLSSVKFWSVVSPGDSTIMSSISSHHPNTVFLEIVRVSLSLSKFCTLLVRVSARIFSQM